MLKMTTNQKERKTRILEAAGNYFGRSGYHLADLDEIAKNAGVGKGTLYRYFSNKEELFIETVAYFADKMYSEIISKIEKNDIERIVEMIFEAHQQYYNKNQYIYKLVTKAVSAMPEKLVSIFHGIHQEKMKNIHSRLVEGMNSGVFRKNDPEIVIKLIDAMANIILLAQEYDGKTSIDDIKSSFAFIFNHGIKV
ncbi:MAG TPA: TetR/AcrR family transcriptional regulator [bacterium]|nr:TetR/AcrR family transcriptional regulator [bacterium]HPS28708.1 TetR/AcrR family transcriptional regulator [bacterium]